MARNYGARSRHQLKYRLLGAAILIGLGILIIPALLEKPGKSTSSRRAAPTAAEGGAGFRSKIEPVYRGALEQAAGSGTRRGKDAPDAGKGAALGQRTVFKPVVDDTLEVSGGAADRQPAEEQAPGAERPPARVAAAKEGGAESLPDAAAPAPKPAPQTRQPAKREPAPEPAARPPATAAAKPAAEPEPPAGGGWVVRVGTFAKKQNAESVVKLLRGRGLAPHQRQVDTRVGKATRIWLGPYPSRDEAGRVSAGLKAVTGEKGYITRAGS